MARSPKTRAPRGGGDAEAQKRPGRKRSERAPKRPAERTGRPTSDRAAASPRTAAGERALAEAPVRRPKPRGSGRQEARLTINKEFESFDAFVSEYVSNLSRSGVFVRTRKPLPVGTKVDLRFTVLMDEVEIVEGVGEVVRVHEDPAGMGLVFRELSGYSEAIIERLLTAQLSAPKGR